MIFDLAYDYINNPTQNCLNQILIRSGSSWTYVVLLQDCICVICGLIEILHESLEVQLKFVLDIFVKKYQYTIKV